MFKEVQEFASAMRDAGLACELEVHPGLGHDFPTGFDADLPRRLAVLNSPR